MPKGLSVSRLIRVSVNLTPQAAQFLNFDSLLMVGDSDVIDTTERMRSYSLLDEVADDFGTNAPEYKAADLFFSQIPQPLQLYIGRWAQAATKGQLRCGILSPAEQVMSLWQTHTSSKFKIDVDGSGPTEVTCGSMAAASNLNAVATIIQTAVQALVGVFAAVTVEWTGTQFVFRSGTTGTNSKVLALTAGTSVDISVQLKGTTATLQREVDGMAAESALDAVTALDDLQTPWYGLTFASSNIDNDDHQAIAGYVQGAGATGGNRHIYGLTTNDTKCLDAGDSSDIGSVLKSLGYTRSFVQYSDNPYAVASFFGRAFTVNFNENNSTITMMWKQEPGVVPQYLTNTQADTLEQKRINVFVQYNNNTAIIEDGVMSGPAYFDEIHGLDWLANRIQTDVWNLLYTSPNKIPQTDSGNHQIGTAIESGCKAGVNNGLLAPGVWNSSGFGNLKQGDFLDKGFYVFVPPVSTQAQADREARKSVPIQVAAKLAGAIHSVDISVLVNR